MERYINFFGRRRPSTRRGQPAITGASSRGADCRTPCSSTHSSQRHGFFLNLPYTRNLWLIRRYLCRCTSLFLFKRQENKGPGLYLIYSYPASKITENRPTIKKMTTKNGQKRPKIPKVPCAFSIKSGGFAANRRHTFLRTAEISGPLYLYLKKTNSS